MMMVMMTVILNKALALVGPLLISLCRAKNIYLVSDDHHDHGDCEPGDDHIDDVVDDNERVGQDG